MEQRKYDVSAAPVFLCITQGVHRLMRVAGLPAAGPMEGDGLPPEMRNGEMWNAFRGLQAAGWDCNGSNYATGFRVSPAHGKDLSTLQVSFWDTRLPWDGAASCECAHASARMSLWGTEGHRVTASERSDMLQTCVAMRSSACGGQ